jgi:hypothetical protein
MRGAAVVMRRGTPLDAAGVHALHGYAAHAADVDGDIAASRRHQDRMHVLLDWLKANPLPALQPQSSSSS